tara:strand:- start:30767 stop:30886 length:120 start_codon:yes stop_codon:yes gene_type:complete
MKTFLFINRYSSKPVFLPIDIEEKLCKNKQSKKQKKEVK